jgi:hypothetical protein
MYIQLSHRLIPNSNIIILEIRASNVRSDLYTVYIISRATMGYFPLFNTTLLTLSEIKYWPIGDCSRGPTEVYTYTSKLHYIRRKEQESLDAMLYSRLNFVVRLICVFLASGNKITRLP